jgi:HEAT repeat protein
MCAVPSTRRLPHEAPAHGSEQALIERTRSGGTPTLRAEAVQALARFDSAQAVDALTKALDDPAVEVRATAGIALAGLRDPASTGALAAIVALWSQPALAACRQAALRALTAFRSEAAAVELARALTAVQPDHPLGLDEQAALLTVVYAEPSGVAAPRVVRTLVALLEHRDSSVADRAAALLELFPAESHGPVSRALRTGASPAARRWAAAALRACRQEAAVAALVAALDDPAAEVRRGAARSLGDLRDPIASAALQAATTDPDEGVRKAAASALVALGAMAAATRVAAGFGMSDRVAGIAASARSR